MWATSPHNATFFLQTISTVCRSARRRAQSSNASSGTWHGVKSNSPLTSSLLNSLGRVAFVGDSCGRELFFAMLRILEPACRGQRVEERTCPLESGCSTCCEDTSSPTAWCNMSNTQPFAGHVPRKKLHHPRCTFETALGGCRLPRRQTVVCCEKE